MKALKNSKNRKLTGCHTNIEGAIQDSHTSPKNVIQEHKSVIQDVIQDNKAVIHPDIQLLTATTEEQKTKIEEYKAQVQGLNAEISRLKAFLMEAPDPVDLARLQERNEGLNLVIAEKEKRIEDLTREVTTLNGFAHYFKTAEVKQIEAPAAEKKKPWYKFW